MSTFLLLSFRFYYAIISLFSPVLAKLWKRLIQFWFFSIEDNDVIYLEFMECFLIFIVGPSAMGWNFQPIEKRRASFLRESETGSKYLLLFEKEDVQHMTTGLKIGQNYQLWQLWFQKVISNAIGKKLSYSVIILLLCVCFGVSYANILAME